MATSLFESLNAQYPDYKLYVAVKPQYAGIVQGSPYVYKVIDYDRRMENIYLMEGHGSRKTQVNVYDKSNDDLASLDFLSTTLSDNYHEGYFDILFLSHANTQRTICYSHNGLDKIALDLKAI